MIVGGSIGALIVVAIIILTVIVPKSVISRKQVVIDGSKQRSDAHTPSYPKQSQPIRDSGETVSIIISRTGYGSECDIDTEATDPGIPMDPIELPPAFDTTSNIDYMELPNFQINSNGVPC